LEAAAKERWERATRRGALAAALAHALAVEDDVASLGDVPAARARAPASDNGVIDMEGSLGDAGEGGEGGHASDAEEAGCGAALAALTRAIAALEGEAGARAAPRLPPLPAGSSFAVPREFTTALAVALRAQLRPFAPPAAEKEPPQKAGGAAAAGARGTQSTLTGFMGAAPLGTKGAGARPPAAEPLCGGASVAALEALLVVPAAGLPPFVPPLCAHGALPPPAAYKKHMRRLRGTVWRGVVAVYGMSSAEVAGLETVLALPPGVPYAAVRVKTRAKQRAALVSAPHARDH
jgi:hypothetical protein